MKRIPTRIEYDVKCDKHTRQCHKCRNWISNEPYAIRWTHKPGGKLSMETRCWRCWHTAEVTQLFLDKWPKLFGRDKYRQWYYLCLDSDQFHFPSTDGEHDPDWQNLKIKGAKRMKKKCVICSKKLDRGAWFWSCMDPICEARVYYCYDCSIKHEKRIRCPRHFLKAHREDVARYKKEALK